MAHDFKVGETLELIDGAIDGIGVSMPLGTRVKVAPQSPNCNSDSVCYYDHGKPNRVTWRPAIYFRRVGPVVERTVREIVPGTYDGVEVGATLDDKVLVRFGTRYAAVYDADELTRAAAVLTAIAEALRDDR